MAKALVFGLAVTGTSVTKALLKRGYGVVCADDSDSQINHSLLGELGVDGALAPTEAKLQALIDDVDFVVPAPGVPERHIVRRLTSAAQKQCVSELDLAYEWEQSRPGGARPVVAVTGTDGKTTTTMLAASMLRMAGHQVVEAGNTDTPFVEAIDSDATAFAVECSSFRLATTTMFRADAATWLNFSPDHLDWHVNLNSYLQAKKQIWAHARPEDVVVYPSDNAMISAHAHTLNTRLVGFGLAGKYRLANGSLLAGETEICTVSSIWRALPHDVDNALAAAALVIETGLAPVEAVARALASFVPPHHRIEFVLEDEGVRWYNDSKATTPHATRTAIRSFGSVVLIAGGRNKDLDLSELALEGDRIIAVVAIGEAIEELTTVFVGKCTVVPASNMTEAVMAANRLARTGDTVLLSPACTSFDWYQNYAERGDDFVRLVKELIGSREG